MTDIIITKQEAINIITVIQSGIYPNIPFGQIQAVLGALQAKLQEEQAAIPQNEEAS